MSKQIPKVFLIVLAFIVGVETLVLFLEPEFSSGVALLRYKASGRLSWIGWDKAIEMAVPSYFRPPANSTVVHQRAYMTTRVQRVEESDGTCGSLWDTKLGRFWASDAEPDLVAYLVAEQLEKKIYEQGEVHIREGDIVVDGGAHIGVFARFALNKGAKKVIAFEPDSRNVECLKKTFEQEIHDSSLVIVEAALWNESTVLPFHLSDQNSARSSAFGKDGAEVNVTATTIDDAVKSLALERIDFIKLDIEGAERRAVQGARDSIERYHPRLALCTYHRPDDPVVITSIVAGFDTDYSCSGSPEVAFFW